jgi:tRNA threonylcarbamoyladenosine biosynthesis protein TsaB
MLILSIDTSTRTGGAAILNGFNILAEVAGLEETPYSSQLFRDVALLQARTGVHTDQIDLFAVASGPGSFTGLRVGLTAVKAWAEVHRKPIAAVSVLEAIAAEFEANPVNSGRKTKFVAPFLDARRGQVFGGVYRRVSGASAGLEGTSDDSILSPSEFLELVASYWSEGVTLVSPTPVAVPADLISQILPGAAVARVSSALAPAIGRIGFERAGQGKLVDSLSLDANYVRRSDAEAAWKDA